jgi:DNA-binding transcriptional regulator YiaG
MARTGAGRSKVPIERRVLPEHAEPLLGLPYPVIVHDAAVQVVDTATGDVRGVSIPDLEGLAAAVSMERCLIPVQLAPQEIRFVREVLQLRSGELAGRIDVDPATFSRYETGAQGVGEQTERLFRIFVCATLADRLPGTAFDPRMITSMKVRRRAEGDPWPEMRFRRVRVKTQGTVADQWDATPLAA